MALLRHHWAMWEVCFEVERCCSYMQLARYEVTLDEQGSGQLGIGIAMQMIDMLRWY